MEDMVAMNDTWVKTQVTESEMRAGVAVGGIQYVSDPMITMK